MDPRPALVLALVLLAAPPTASAHLDAPVGSGEESFSLAPGESRAFPFFVHYHRLIGQVAVEGGAPVRLAIYDEAAHQALAAGAPAEPFWRSGPIRGAQGLNVLVDCCDGTGDERYHLVASHAGGDAGVASVRLAAKAAHDDLLVGLSGAEGDAFQNAGVFWVIGGVLAYRLARDARASPAPAPASSAMTGPAPAPARDREASRLLRRSALWAAAPYAVALVAGAWGTWRYGGGVVAGLVATFGVAFPSFGSALLVLAFAVGWTGAAVFWLRAHRRVLAGARGAAGRVLAVGVAEAVAFVATPFLLVPEYGARVLLIGSLMALPFALVLFAGAIHLALRARRTAEAAEPRAAA